MKTFIFIILIVIIIIYNINLNLESFSSCHNHHIKSNAEHKEHNKYQEHQDHNEHNEHNEHKNHLDKMLNPELIQKANEACANDITDIEYLEHMIPHHQVAIDISRILQKTSKLDYMQNILRKLIYLQEHDIMIMKHMLKRLSPSVSDSTIRMNRRYIATVANFTKPNTLGLTKVYCDPLFFDEKAHMEHLDMMGLIETLDDKAYLEHMIPHHQVAIDMSKKLLKNTKNDFMIYLCYRIIRSQEEEVVMLNDILQSNNYKWQSNLIL